MGEKTSGNRRVAAAIAALVLLFAPSAPRAASFVNFESGQVRPLALSSDRSRLYAVNTPDNRLEVLAVSGAGLEKVASVPVGLEPVAVALRSDGEAWVVNHLSDSVSIVDLTADPPRVRRTLLVGDEPRDIVFAGPGRSRAFVTTAHRGQNIGFDPLLTTAGVGRADVWVFDAGNLGASLGGTPLTVLKLFGDTPRPLATSPDGTKVYAGVHFSGNRSTVIGEGAVCDGSESATCALSDGTAVPGGVPEPRANHQGIEAPEVGLIVQHDGSAWRDTLGRNWNPVVRFSLPDKDVFQIDATANPPVESGSWRGVGTILFNIAVNPANGRIYVSNTEAMNLTRFEGPGDTSTTVQGDLHRSRITVLDGSLVRPRHLNKHIDYAQRPVPAGVKERSLAQPLEMAITSDGSTLYVAAFGSSKIGVFSTAELESDGFVPDAADHVALGGGGPTGIVLDEPRQRLYVLTRFTNSIAVVDTQARVEVASTPLYDREPAEVFGGRPFLYDANFSSGNGEASCGSCHVFGDLDHLAWDLGNPDDDVTSNPMLIRLSLGAGADVNGGAATNQFHPMKGPMTTQTLRGMQHHGPMHWRGDRSNGFFGAGTGEALSFNNFIVAFTGLLGRASLPQTAQMNEFTNFALSLVLPPNPVRSLDNALTADQQAGRDFYNGSRLSDGTTQLGLGFNCNGCHVLDPAQGFFGADGNSSFEGESQIVKVAHLRNLYTRVGMFGMAPISFFLNGDNGGKGDQVRGFGFTHEGSVDTLFRFFRARAFQSDADSGFNGGDAQRRQMVQFMLAFDNDLAPIVGQQVTLDATNAAVALPRIALLIQRCSTPFVSKELGGNVTECDLVVKGVVDGEERGWLLVGSRFRSDRFSEALLTDAELRVRAATPGQALTYTAVAPGTGVRIALDRDEDGAFDRTEVDQGSDASDPTSVPTGSGSPPVLVGASKLQVRNSTTRIDVRTLNLSSLSKRDAPSGVVAPTWDSADDPTTGGAVLTVFRPSGGTPAMMIPLPAAGWSRKGTIWTPVYTFKSADRKVTATVQGGKLVLKAKGAEVYDLAAAPQGLLAARLDFAGGLSLCSAFAAGKNDSTTKFDGVTNAPAPASCPLAS